MRERLLDNDDDDNDAHRPNFQESIKELSKEHLISLATMMPKFFMSGFFWNAARELALTHGYTETDQITLFSEGFGDGFGVALGNFVTEAFLKFFKLSDSNSNSWTAISLRTAQYGLAAFFTGWSWTPIVTQAQETIADQFYAVSAFTYLLCGGIFFGGLIGSRYLINLKSEVIAPVNVKTLVEDISLGLVKAGAAAGCFTLTSYIQFFKPMIGQLTLLDKISNCAKAGLTTGPIGLTMGESITFISEVSTKLFLTCKDSFFSYSSRNIQNKTNRTSALSNDHGSILLSFTD